LSLAQRVFREQFGLPQRISNRLARRVFCEAVDQQQRVSNRNCAANRNRRNLHKTNGRAISNRNSNRLCGSAPPSWANEHCAPPKCISNRFCTTNRNRRNLLKTNDRKIS